MCPIYKVLSVSMVPNPLEEKAKSLVVTHTWLGRDHRSMRAPRRCLGNKYGCNTLMPWTVCSVPKPSHFQLVNKQWIGISFPN